MTKKQNDLKQEIEAKRGRLRKIYLRIRRETRVMPAPNSAAGKGLKSLEQQRGRLQKEIRRLEEQLEELSEEDED